MKGKLKLHQNFFEIFKRNNIYLCKFKIKKKLSYFYVPVLINSILQRKNIFYNFE